MTGERCHRRHEADAAPHEQRRVRGIDAVNRDNAGRQSPNADGGQEQLGLAGSTWTNHRTEVTGREVGIDVSQYGGTSRAEGRATKLNHMAPLWWRRLLSRVL